LHPVANFNPDPHSFLTGLPPSANRAGDTLTLYMIPFGDNQPGQSSLGFSAVVGGKVSGAYQVDQNGQRVAGGTIRASHDGVPWFSTQVKLGAQPATVSFALTASRTGPGFPLSTVSHTVWAWRSVRTPGTTLPANWYCFLRGNTEVTRCAVQPMMTLRYAVAGLSLTGQVPAGREVVDLTVGHLQLVKPIAVTRATMSVSFDGGKTWHQAQVTGRDGRYQAVFDAPAGVYVMTRTSAQDAAGGSVTETLTRAFLTAS
jgi:hypothetical protein